MRNTKNKYKYKSYSNKSANINPQYFRNKINETKKLYMPQYNNLSKTKMDTYKYNEDNYNLGSSKKYLKFKQILNNYMSDYEKLKKQNKIPEYEDKSYYSYQEFEIEKNNVRELFDSIIDLNGHDEFNDTDKIIQNLPDDFDNMFLKNDTTKKDYALRYEIINGEKLEETSERLRSKTENNINQDVNKLNQNCLFENNEEDENDENNNINNIKNININKQTNEIKNDNIIEDNNNIDINNRINKDEEININNINQKIEELNNNNIIENNNKVEEEEKNNNENNNEETSKEQNNNNTNEQYTSNNNNNINELNSENKIDEEKNTDNKNEQEEKKENEEEEKENKEENNINNEEKKELENEVGQNKFKKFRESEEKEVSEDKDKKEESLEKYDDFE